MILLDHLLLLLLRMLLILLSIPNLLFCLGLFHIFGKDNTLDDHSSCSVLYLLHANALFGRLPEWIGLECILVFLKLDQRFLFDLDLLVEPDEVCCVRNLRLSIIALAMSRKFGDVLIMGINSLPLLSPIIVRLCQHLLLLLWTASNICWSTGELLLVVLPILIIGVFRSVYSLPLDRELLDAFTIILRAWMVGKHIFSLKFSATA